MPVESLLLYHCSRKHHTLIHEDKTFSAREVPELPSTESGRNFAAALCGFANTYFVLLATALVYIRDCTGVLHSVRALVDSTFQISSMTEKCAARVA